MAAAPRVAANPMKFLERPPRFLFFTGKGGVGKTSIACATAINLAGQGRSVLLAAGDTFRGMLGQEYARAASQGLSLGIADALYGQFSRHLTTADD